MRILIVLILGFAGFHAEAQLGPKAAYQYHPIPQIQWRQAPGRAAVPYGPQPAPPGYSQLQPQQNSKEANPMAQALGMFGGGGSGMDGRQPTYTPTPAYRSNPTPAAENDEVVSAPPAATTVEPKTPLAAKEPEIVSTPPPAAKSDAQPALVAQEKTVAKSEPPAAPMPVEPTAAPVQVATPPPPAATQETPVVKSEPPVPSQPPEPTAKPQQVAAPPALAQKSTKPAPEAADPNDFSKFHCGTGLKSGTDKADDIERMIKKYLGISDPYGKSLIQDDEQSRLVKNVHPQIWLKKSAGKLLLLRLKVDVPNHESYNVDMTAAASACISGKKLIFTANNSRPVSGNRIAQADDTLKFIVSKRSAHQIYVTDELPIYNMGHVDSTYSARTGH